MVIPAYRKLDVPKMYDLTARKDLIYEEICVPPTNLDAVLRNSIEIDYLCLNVPVNPGASEDTN